MSWDSHKLYRALRRARISPRRIQNGNLLSKLPHQRPLYRKHIFLAGATGKVGRALAKELATQGAYLSLFARHATRLHRLSQSLEAHNVRSITVPGNISKPQQLAASLKLADQNMGPIDCGVFSINEKGASEEFAVQSRLTFCEKMMSYMSFYGKGTVFLLHCTTGKADHSGIHAEFPTVKAVQDWLEHQELSSQTTQAEVHSIIVEGEMGSFGHLPASRRVCDLILRGLLEADSQSVPLHRIHKI